LNARGPRHLRRNRYICAMYVPAEFQVSDKEEVLSFLRSHPFGVLVSNGENGLPVVAHLPFLLKEEGEKLFAEVHMAKVNELSDALVLSGKATMIIQGAHGYVSSSVYTHMNVPTYNYQAVHLSGTVTILEKEALLQHLKEVVADFEKNREHPIDFEKWPKEMIHQFMEHISGFRLEISVTEAAFKLSQNRNATDFERIITDLQTGSLHEQQLAEAMLKTRKHA